MYTGAVCSVCYIIHAGIYFQLNKTSCMIDVKSTVLDEAKINTCIPCICKSVRQV